MAILPLICSVVFTIFIRIFISAIAAHCLRKYASKTRIKKERQNSSLISKMTGWYYLTIGKSDSFVRFSLALFFISVTLSFAIFVFSLFPFDFRLSLNINLIKAHLVLFGFAYFITLFYIKWEKRKKKK